MSWVATFEYQIRDRGSLPAPAVHRAAVAPRTRRPLLLCLSHLRWNFVYQRPQHLMSRFASTHDVLFFEEPLTTSAAEPWLERIPAVPGVTRLVPRLPAGLAGASADAVLKRLLDGALQARGQGIAVAWFYTPMSLPFCQHLEAGVTVYDCMDELSAFRFSPPELIERECSLLDRADVVFTGGYSLHESKRDRHANTHAFPSSVDVAHFAQARVPQDDPPDQAGIPHPRLGFYGVLDERLDLELLERIAARRPDWHIVLLGPLAKIDAGTLPQRPNIHLLGARTYAELPGYLAGWDVTIMPFALNASTRFISPTKTPEYLAGGKPVVSTGIADVVRGYGDSGIVRIADGADAFIEAVAAALAESGDRDALHASADAALGDMSWDRTWQAMTEAMRCAS